MGERLINSMEDNPIQTIDEFAEIFREYLEKYAFEMIVDNELYKLDRDSAWVQYFESVSLSPIYLDWKRCIDAIIDDCVEEFGLERWMADSMLGINLDRDTYNGFIKAWKVIYQ